MKASKEFIGLVRCCLALPFIIVDELQATVDTLKEMIMEDRSVEKARDDFLEYIQKVWIDGLYSPDIGSCYGRKTDHTNNAQEAYNAVFNR